MVPHTFANTYINTHTTGTESWLQHMQKEKRKGQKKLSNDCKKLSNYCVLIYMMFVVAGPDSSLETQTRDKGVRVTQHIG